MDRWDAVVEVKNEASVEGSSSSMRARNLEYYAVVLESMICYPSLVNGFRTPAPVITVRTHGDPAPIRFNFVLGKCDWYISQRRDDTKKTLLEFPRLKQINHSGVFFLFLSLFALTTRNSRA